MAHLADDAALLYRGEVLIEGRADSAGTDRIARAHPELLYQPFGKTNVAVSQVGFGGYRVHARVEAHQKALEAALDAGINLIDTSANYGDGGSEELVGQILGEMIAAGKVQRDEVVIVSKAGYLQGQNYEMSQERQRQGQRFPDLVQVEPGLEHCIHPQFLADQLTRSLDRLRLGQLDVYLLHNPEYFLDGAQKAGVSLSDARKSYYQRIELAFRHLEDEAKAGRIGWYGVSSNSFPAASDAFNFTDLSHLWKIAESLRAEHHFRVVQFPMNLFESGAATEPNQPNGGTTLAFARKVGLATLINRPLNAMLSGGMLRLAGAPLPASTATLEEIEIRIEDMAQAEQLLRSLLLEQEPSTAPMKKAQEMLVVGGMLRGQWDEFGSYHQWMEILAQQLATRVNYGLHLLADEAFSEEMPAKIDPWMRDYAELANQTFAAISSHYQEKSAQRANLIKSRVQLVDPEWQNAGSLSRLAIRALRTTSGVNCVLVGMRDEAYVADVVAELKKPVPVVNRDEAWRRLGI